ncbi:MAG: ABC transporter permease, partial [Desulfomonilaceae bacterium]
LFKSKDLIVNLVHRELTVRYKRSVIGFMWTMLNPVIMTVVYMIVFSTIFRFGTRDFIIYFLSAYLVWNFFSQSTTTASKCIINAGSLIKKVYIPKVVLVLSVIVSALVNFGAALIPLLIVVPILGKGLNVAMFFLVVPFVLVTMFTLGIALILASMTVFFLDVGEFYSVILMPWMFLTPIMYPMDIVPVKYHVFIKMNPMYYFIECFRYPIYNGTLPSLRIIVMSAIMAVVTLIIGYRVFTKAEDDFVYYV